MKGTCYLMWQLNGVPICCRLWNDFASRRGCCRWGWTMPSIPRGLCQLKKTAPLGATKFAKVYVQFNCIMLFPCAQICSCHIMILHSPTSLPHNDTSKSCISNFFSHPLRADLHGTTLSHATTAYDRPTTWFTIVVYVRKNVVAF